MCELRITHTWRETTNFLGPILPYEGVLFWNRAYFSLDFSWHWLIGNYQKSEVTYPKSETVVMLNWCWSAVWWKNNLPTQITPLTQKSGPVITGGDISVIQKQQGLIFLVIIWQKRKRPLSWWLLALYVISYWMNNHCADQKFTKFEHLTFEDCPLRLL